MGIFGSKPNSSKLYVGGYTNEKFQGVRKSFEDLLVEERDGLSLAVYVNDELVVDLWGGFADSDAGRKWTEDTMTCVYSISKTFGYLVVAKLVSDGKLRYEDKVTKYWPEFGQHGKEVLTIEDVMNHKAGLIGFCKDITLEDNEDLDKISKIIEESKPYWPPGSGTGYHALTIGFLVDQIVRRVDPKKRTVSQLYHEEIRGKDTEFYLGLPKEEFYRMARITNPPSESLLAYLKHPWTLFGMLFLLQLAGKQKMFNVMFKSVPFLEISESGCINYNNPDILATGNIATTGVGSARGVAKAILEFFEGNILSAEIKQLLCNPTEESSDIITDWKSHKGHGCMYFPHPVYDKKYLLFADGHGGQLVFVDVESNISIALLRNGLKPNHAIFSTYHLLPSEILRIALGDNN
ncbi:beta-lactamase domain-containing protein [Ditylenchus destructor]|nr:beta-lactamase domain-containing protein [Ditylenchus destructor]